ncbi:skin secretory protein xP2-like [Iris pallida]|uniref:Skin secretory protein xP2-like n=1 Tax=Iris pallida TaxID=29817 RepID=A0AAX6I8S0_IRIPA|nr:skin secretory protein xP2-like [Iris pallida]
MRKVRGGELTKRWKWISFSKKRRGSTSLSHRSVACDSSPMLSSSPLGRGAVRGGVDLIVGPGGGGLGSASASPGWPREA